MSPRPRAAGQRGRRDSNERVRDLVALLGSLSSTGDTVSIEAISTRLGVSIDEARGLMDIVCQASGEESTGLLISCNDDETEYTLQFPGVSGRPVRLTQAESIAVSHALDVAGVTEDDPLRVKLTEAFASPSLELDGVRRSLGAATSDPILTLCARAQVEGRALRFTYKGLRDPEPRVRTVQVCALQPQGESWHVVAVDCELGEERVFRTDRMSDAALADRVESDAHPASAASAPRMLRAVFSPRTYYDLFDWPGVTVVQEDDNTVVCDIAYYGEASGWLERRIAACDGTLMVEDKRIMDAARYYARSELV